MNHDYSYTTLLTDEFLLLIIIGKHVVTTLYIVVQM